MSEPETSRRIEGGCHCGNIRFTLFWPGAGESIPVRACGCSFCVKHGGTYTSHPGARVDVRIADPAAVERYRFGTGTADFHICRACGVVPVITGEMEGKLYCVVNVNTFEGFDPAQFIRSDADFEGESLETRLARRRRNWIPDVRFE